MFGGEEAAGLSAEEAGLAVDPAASRPKPEAKPGDWICAACGDLQFARNVACRSCGGFGKGGCGKGHVTELANGQKAKPGDWICPMCDDLQFARNMACRNCFGYGKGGPGGKGGKPPAPALPAGSTERSLPGDWLCQACGDLQFARNLWCRKCGASGPHGGKGGCGGGFGGGFGKGMVPFFGAKGFGKGFGKQVEVHGDPGQLVYVGNIKYEVKWQDLKDHMKQAGTVEFCRILTDDGTDWGRSKGAACVRFSTAEEAQCAITTLSESELQGRNILVDSWTGGRRTPGKGAAS